MKKEESLQIAVCNYIRMAYPKVIFTSEASGLKLTIGQAVKMKKMRSNAGLPDLIILHPSPNSNWAGLCLELKIKSPFKANGSLKNDQHLKKQDILLSKLRIRGYWATFAIGFDNAKEIIDDYMKEKQ